MSSDAFAGRVLSSKVDTTTTDVAGPHTVMYPTSAEDVAVALKLTKNAHRDLIVRFGTTLIPRKHIDGSGAVVVNLRRLDSIGVSGTTVKVGAAATVEELSEKLVEHKLFLPLSTQALQSVAGNVLSTDPGYMTRSAGLLREYVEEVEFARSDGTVGTASEDANYDLLQSVLAGENNTVITSIIFRALSEAEAAKFWVAHFFMHYSTATYGRLVRLAYTRPQELPSTVDLVVRAGSGNHNVPYVCMSVAGQGDQAECESVVAKMKKHVHADSLRLPGLEVPSSVSVGVDVLSSIADIGDLGGFSHGLSSSKHEKQVEIRDFPRFAGMFSRIVDFGLGSNENGHVHFCDLSMAARLFLTEENKVHASVTLFAASEFSPSEARFYQLLCKLMPLSPSLQQRKSLQEDLAAEVSGLISFPSAPPPVVSDDPKEMAKQVKESVIPGFKGEIFTPQDPHYIEKAHVYATTSYPAEEMTPGIVAYPTDEEDISAAVLYAKDTGKRVVARSGGHQYCGLSSGGHDALVLSMDLFNNIKVSGNKATLGVGCHLTHIAAEFKDHGVTIPHGECPLVCIGGHVQTGGYGHLLRSFGLALDYVYSFDIVDAEGKVQTVTRPTKEGEKGLFWAVLGGGPMSWGVLTHITFEAIRDVDHPYSRGHMSARGWEKDVFKEMLNVVREWTVAIENGTENLPDDVDLMCTATSTDIWNPLRHGPAKGALLLEMVHGNKAGWAGKRASEAAQEFFEDIYNRVEKNRNWLNLTLVSFHGRRPLSYMSDSFVRRTGTTSDGREFKYPYEKSLNGTKHALPDSFVEGFVNLVSETIDAEGLRLVFQMGLGGGAYGKSERKGLTSISRRDIVFAVVYDVFYQTGYQAKAYQFHSKMKALLDRDIEEKDTIRFTWGSYGDTDIENVRDYYYDSPQLYEQLQSVKRDVDPANVFRTRFTVQP